MQSRGDPSAAPDANQTAAELDLLRRGRIFNFFCGSGALVLFLGVAVRSLADRRLPPTLGVALLVIALLVIAPAARRRSTLVADVIACLAVVIAVPATLAENGGVNASGMVFLPLIPIVMAGFLGGRAALLIAATLLLTVVAIWMTAGH